MVNASTPARATWTRAEVAYTAAALHFVGALIMLTVSFHTGDFSWTILFTRYQGALFITGYSVWSVVLAWKVAAGFAPGDKMRFCFRALLLAAFVRLISAVCVQLLTQETALNPLYLWWPNWTRALGERIFHYGVHIGGPFHYAVLLAGILCSIRVYKGLGLLRPFQPVDYAIGLALTAHIGVQIYTLWFWIAVESAETSIGWWLGWATDPLLAATLAAAIVMRRASGRLRGGLLERGWTALAAAAAFVAAGNVSLWAMRADYIMWPHDSLTWLIWYLPPVFFVVSSSHQLEAMDLAAGRQ